MNRKFNSKIIVTSALVGASFLGYQKRAHAAYSGCHHTTGTSYVCDSADTAMQDFSDKDNAVITTESGFSVNTATDNAITITGTGALSFTDTHASTIKATTAGFFSGQGLLVDVTGDDDSTPGSITISTNSHITAATHGIRTFNDGTGSTSITVTGDITAGGAAIGARSTSGAIDITTAIASDIASTSGIGISIQNNGTALSTTTVNGHVSSSSSYGILARAADTSTGITIITGSKSSVRSDGEKAAIFADNSSTTGAINITVNGDVLASGNDEKSSGILAFSAYNTDSNITITNGATVEGENAAIAPDDDSTKLNITLDGTTSAVSITGRTGTAIPFGTGNDAITITGDVYINGSITGGEGTDTLSIGASNITMSTGSEFSGFESASITGKTTLQAGKTLTIGSSTAVAVNTAGSLAIAIDNDSSVGKLVATHGITFSGDDKLTIDAANVTTIDSGTTLLNIVSGGTVSGITSGSLTDNNPIYKFTSVVHATSIDILVERDLFVLATTGNASTVGNALDTIGLSSRDETLNHVISTIGNYSTSAEKAAALKTLAPDISGSTTASFTVVADESANAIENHIEETDTNGYAGLATGGSVPEKGIWIKLFGKDIRQGFRKGIDGYDANSDGFTIGGDVKLNEKSRLGTAISYAATKAKSLFNRTKTDTVQGTIYSHYDMSPFDIQGMGSVAFSHSDGDRSLFDGSTARSNFDGYQLSAKIKAGYKTHVGTYNLTPFTSLGYSFINQQDVTETGSSANLHIARDDLQVLKSGLGMQLSRPFIGKELTCIPHVSAGWYYDLLHNTPQIDSSFTAAPSVIFASRGAPQARNSFSLASGIDLFAADHVTFSVNYHLDTRASLQAHTGALKVRMEF